MKDFNEQEIYLLNQELDELKAEKEQYKKQIRFDEAGIKLLEGSVESLQQQIQQYKQCLEEIEGICNRPLCPVSCKFADIILQKIKQAKECK